MKSRAAAKGRKLLFLAAVCLLPALLLSPTADASRGVPSAALNLEPPAPRWDAEAPRSPQLDLFHLEDELLVEVLTGVEPEHHQALLEHRRLALLSPSSWASAIQKTASGVSTSDLQLNVQKGKPLKPDLRWTVPFYAKARFYDPEVGRFLSEDPAEPDLTTPPSLHKYLYAYGNPTVYWDPDGRISLLSDLSAALGDSKEGLIAAAGANTPDESTGFFARGWKQFHTATLGMRAGVAGIAQGGVDLLNLGVNASLVNQTATMGLSFGTLTDEATAEFLTGASSLVETAEIIRENPKAVAATVYNNAKEVVKAAAAGDHEAQARVQALVTEIAVDVAIGSKGVKSAIGLSAKTTETIVDTSLDIAKGVRRTADLVNDVDVPSVRLPKLKPKPQKPHASASTKTAPTDPSGTVGNWQHDLNEINVMVERLGRNALSSSGGNWDLSEKLFERSLRSVRKQLEKANSKYSFEFQPASLVNDGRVPAYYQEVWGEGRLGRIWPYPDSRRLDAAVVDTDFIIQGRYGGTFNKVVSGFDISLNQNKKSIIDYYKEAFGSDVPIFDVRSR